MTRARLLACLESIRDNHGEDPEAVADWIEAGMPDVVAEAEALARERIYLDAWEEAMRGPIFLSWAEKKAAQAAIQMWAGSLWVNRADDAFDHYFGRFLEERASIIAVNPPHKEAARCPDPN